MSKYDFLITGASGQLGRALQSNLEKRGYSFLAASKQDLDISDVSEVVELFRNFSFSWIINCAAITDLDKSEISPLETYETNSKGVLVLTSKASEVGAKLIQISTDAVFSSEEPRYFKELDRTCPVNVYGFSKAEGERYVMDCALPAWILRTSWLYGEHGSRFVDSMVKAALRGENREIVDDQFGQPTLTKHLIEAIFLIINGQIEPGICHISRNEYISRYEFANLIFSALRANRDYTLTPVKSEYFSEAAKRSKYSLLHPTKIISQGTSVEKTSYIDDAQYMCRLRGIK